MDWSYSILPLVLRPHHLSSTYTAGPAGIYHIRACLSPPFPLPCLLCLDAFPLVAHSAPGPPLRTYMCLLLLLLLSLLTSSFVRRWHGRLRSQEGKKPSLIAPFYFSLTALGEGGFRQWAISTKRAGKRRNHTKRKSK